jgi:hypothetical protein
MSVTQPSYDVGFRAAKNHRRPTAPVDVHHDARLLQPERAQRMGEMVDRVREMRLNGVENPGQSLYRVKRWAD